MRKIFAMVLFSMLLLAFSPVNASAYELQNVRCKVLTDNDGNVTSEAIFYDLQEVCKAFDYDIYVDDEVAIIQGIGLTNSHGAAAKELYVKLNSNCITVITDDTAQVELLPEKCETFARDGKVYVFNSFFNDYMGLATTVTP